MNGVSLALQGHEGVMMNLVFTPKVKFSYITRNPLDTNLRALGSSQAADPTRVGAWYVGT